MSRTKTDLQERFKHYLTGIVLDALTMKREPGPQGLAELGQKSQGLVQRMEDVLGMIHDYMTGAMIPEKKAEHNGAKDQRQTQPPQPQRVK